MVLVALVGPFSMETTVAAFQAVQAASLIYRRAKPCAKHVNLSACCMLTCGIKLYAWERLLKHP